MGLSPGLIITIAEGCNIAREKKSVCSRIFDVIFDIFSLFSTICNFSLIPWLGHLHTFVSPADWFLYISAVPTVGHLKFFEEKMANARTIKICFSLGLSLGSIIIIMIIILIAEGCNIAREKIFVCARIFDVIDIFSLFPTTCNFGLVPWVGHLHTFVSSADWFLYVSAFPTVGHSHIFGEKIANARWRISVEAWN